MSDKFEMLGRDLAEIKYRQWKEEQLMIKELIVPSVDTDL
jgi:peroxiredoxin